MGGELTLFILINYYNYSMLIRIEEFWTKRPTTSL